jgi:hypothetical protein
MKTTLTMILVLALAPLGWSDTSILTDASTQQYIAAIRSELSSGKVDAINGLLELSPGEASVFWPIYQQYEDELFAIGDRRLAMIEEFGKAVATDTLNDEFASKLAALP